MPSTTTRPTRARAISSAAPRRRWSTSTASASIPRRITDTLSYDLTTGPGQRADALRRDDRLHPNLLQPRPHPEPLGGAPGHERLPAPAGQFHLRPAALVRAAAGEPRRPDRRSSSRARSRPRSSKQRQRRLDDETRDVLEEETADEEDCSDGREENEVAGGAVAGTASSPSRSPSCMTEREQVRKLLDLARKVDALGQRVQVRQAPRG